MAATRPRTRLAGTAAKLTAALTAAVTAALLSGCAQAAASPSQTGATTLHVYATTGYLADAVHNIAPKATVQTMVGPGGDPHTYQPSTKDIQNLQAADVVFWNGLHLEAQMIKQLESLGNKQLAVGEKLPAKLLLDWPQTDSAGHKLHDPHIWNSPAAWHRVVQLMAQKLGEIDPRNAAQYTANAKTYNKKIAAAVAAAHDKLAAGKISPRILVTGHDAFNYFGQTFDLAVYATDFVSTEAKLSPTKLSALADYIVQHRVPVIFQDNQVNPQAITSLKEAVRARGWQVRVSKEPLYADSLGAQSPVNTYIGALTHNAAVIADALAAAEEK